MASAGPSVRQAATKRRTVDADGLADGEQGEASGRNPRQLALRDRGRADVGSFTTDVRVVATFANLAARRFAFAGLGDLNADTLRITR